MPTRPAFLATPGVVTGAGFVKQTTFRTAPIGNISDIYVSPTNRSVTIAGENGEATFTTAGALQSSLAWSGVFDRVTIARMNGKMPGAYLQRGAWSSPSTLYGTGGSILWTAPQGQGINDATPVDVYGNGATEFAVSYNGAGGVSLFNAAGTQIWNQPDSDAWHVEAINSGSGTAQYIVNSNAAGQITVRNGLGQAVSTSSAPFYINSFSVCRWPTSTSTEYLLAGSGGSFWLLTPNGSVFKQLNAPGSNLLEEAYGTPVRLRPGKPDYLAVLSTPQMTSWNRSILYIYDPAGKLVYEEVLPASGSCVGTLPAPAASRPESLLVGGNGVLWKY